MNSHFHLPADLHSRSMIHAFWQVDAFHTFQKEHIIPKGVVEIIFNFSTGAPITAQLGRLHYNLPNCFINGFNTMPVQLELPRQQVFFGVVFQPLAVKKIFGAPAGEFSDLPVDLTLLDPSFHSLWHQLAEPADFSRRVAIFTAWLKKNFIDWEPQEQLINQFLYAPGPPDLSVTKIAHALCYSPRHLSRKLLEATGMNTEEVLLYKKYLRAVDLMHQEGLSLTEIAYQSDFFDQSHFIKTFKAYAGLTPGKYQRNRSPVKGHLYEDVR